MSDNPAKLPRFPIIGALLCAACVGAAGWTWMRYSYCWQTELTDVAAPDTARRLMHYYVLLRGEVTGTWGAQGEGGLFLGPREPESNSTSAMVIDGVYEFRRTGEHEYTNQRVSGYGDEDISRNPHTYQDGGIVVSTQAEFDGRVTGCRAGFFRKARTMIVVDATASRFTWHSIAGLVAAAMGVFVFTVTLRHWLGERRKFREEARA